MRGKQVSPPAPFRKVASGSRLEVATHTAGMNPAYLVTSPLPTQAQSNVHRLAEIHICQRSRPRAAGGGWYVCCWDPAGAGAPSWDRLIAAATSRVPSGVSLQVTTTQGA